MQITSTQNPRFKFLLKLKTSTRQRNRERLMLVEGVSEISLAIAAGYKPKTIITSPLLVHSPLDTVGVEVISLNKSMYEKLSFRENPDGWLAVFDTPQLGLTSINLSSTPLIIIAESVEKPGNLGAIIRTADAAGVDAILVCESRTDIYGPNVVRASRGALFSVPIVETTNDATLSFLRDHKIRIVATSPIGQVEYVNADLSGSLALAIGTEDKGLTGFWLDHADVIVRIPMRGRVNSLNASISAALVIYESIHQRGA
jgi:TrmH family RNA methyltransferase